MAKATWLGEEATKDLEETTRFGIVFKKGEAVEINRPDLYRKLLGNPNFKMEGEAPKGGDERPPDFVKGQENFGLHKAPSVQSAQGPVPKPGEPYTIVAEHEERPPEPAIDPEKAKAPLMPPPPVAKPVPKRP